MYPILRREASGGDFETLIQRSSWGVKHELTAVKPEHVRLLVQLLAIGQQGDQTAADGLSRILPTCTRPTTEESSAAQIQNIPP